LTIAANDLLEKARRVLAERAADYWAEHGSPFNPEERESYMKNYEGSDAAVASVAVLLALLGAGSSEAEQGSVKPKVGGSIPPPYATPRKPWKTLGDCVAGINNACAELSAHLAGLGAEGLTLATVTISPKVFDQIGHLLPKTNAIGLADISFRSNIGQIKFRPGDPAGAVAQLAERRLPTPDAEGSIPSSPAKLRQVFFDQAPADHVTPEQVREWLSKACDCKASTIMAGECDHRAKFLERLLRALMHHPGVSSQARACIKAAALE
jgi:hypothetical protein